MEFMELIMIMMMYILVVVRDEGLLMAPFVTMMIWYILTPHVMVNLRY
jgi:hypothetical protein